jgi:hypothetical protein
MKRRLCNAGVVRIILSLRDADRGDRLQLTRKAQRILPGSSRIREATPDCDDYDRSAFSIQRILVLTFDGVHGSRTRDHV